MENQSKMSEERTLPEYLKELRRTCHYKQDFVASMLHITRQTYSHYETGRIKPPAGRLYRLAKLYGVPVEKMLACCRMDELDGEEPEWLDGERAADEGMPEEFKESSMDYSSEAFLYYFQKMNEKDKIEIISLMKIKEKNNGESKKE